MHYSKLSIAFKSSTIFQTQLIENGLGGISFKEISTTPFQKNYDDFDHPTKLVDQFSMENWSVIMVEGKKGENIGGCIIAWNEKRVNMLRDRDDLAVLWDIRVDENYRGNGIGALLFDLAKRWAIEKHCSEIHIETQNNNPAACKFYHKMGCHITSIDNQAYMDFPKEVQIIWSIKL